MQSSNLVRLALRTRTTAFFPRCSSNNIFPAQSFQAVRSTPFSSWLDRIAGGNKDTDIDTDSSKPSSPFAAKSAESDVKVEKVRVAACGDIDSDEEDEMEQEEMFVEAFTSPSFEHRAPEWGGPRRGGRLPEPTRFGDWERKGRCSDF